MIIKVVISDETKERITEIAAEEIRTIREQAAFMLKMIVDIRYEVMIDKRREKMLPPTPPISTPSELGIFRFAAAQGVARKD